MKKGNIGIVKELIKAAGSDAEKLLNERYVPEYLIYILGII